MKAAVPPAASSRASTGSGTASAPTQMSTRSPAVRAAAATVSRPGPGPLGRVHPAYAEGGELAAQPGVGLVFPARTSATVMPASQRHRPP